MAKKKDINTIQITFRAPAEAIEHLDLLCNMYGIKRSDFFVSAISAEYDKVNGNPQIKKLLAQLKEVSETVKAFNVPTSD